MTPGCTDWAWCMPSLPGAPVLLQLGIAKGSPKHRHYRRVGSVDLGRPQMLTSRLALSNYCGGRRGTLSCHLAKALSSVMRNASPAFPNQRPFFISGWLLLAAVASPMALWASSATGSRTQGVAGSLSIADNYYLARQEPANVDRGLQVLRQIVAEDPNDFEAWWRIARSESYLGRKAPEDKAAIHDFQAGVEAGRKAVALEPNRVEGHFWLGANYGLMAETEGWIKGLRLIDTVRNEMETVIRLNPDYEQAAGQRTLARLYYRAPFFKGGDKQRSIALLQDCLKRYPRDSFAMLYLADDYVSVGRREEARALLDGILSLRGDPAYGPELADNQEEARDRLREEFRTGK